MKDAARVPSVVAAGVAQVQVWAPGLESSALCTELVAGLERAHLQVLRRPSADSLHGDSPALLLYADPLVRLLTSERQADGRDDRQLFSALPALLAAGIPCRLVNLSCAVIPALVAWAIDPGGDVQAAWRCALPEPDPLDALLALQCFSAHDEPLLAYRALEEHPLAAGLDHRPPDGQCLERYQRAASLPGLLQARRDRRTLEADLQDLASQLEPLRHQELESLALRDQVDLLQARLQEAAALQARCSDLQLSLQAQQQDLEQMARRLALLEGLVSEAAEASRRIQAALARGLLI